jgi:hypothetical protein
MLAEPNYSARRLFLYSSLGSRGFFSLKQDSSRPSCPEVAATVTATATCVPPSNSAALVRTSTIPPILAEIGAPFPRSYSIDPQTTYCLTVENTLPRFDGLILITSFHATHVQWKWECRRWWELSDRRLSTLQYPIPPDDHMGRDILVSLISMGDGASGTSGGAVRNAFHCRKRAASQTTLIFAWMNEREHAGVETRKRCGARQWKRQEHSSVIADGNGIASWCRSQSIPR